MPIYHTEIYPRGEHKSVHAPQIRLSRCIIDYIRINKIVTPSTLSNYTVAYNSRYFSYTVFCFFGTSGPTLRLPKPSSTYTDHWPIHSHHLRGISKTGSKQSSEQTQTPPAFRTQHLNSKIDLSFVSEAIYSENSTKLYRFDLSKVYRNDNQQL